MASLILDEDAPLSLAAELRGAGYDTIHVQEAGLKGSSDQKVLDAAVARGSVLITADLGIADVRPLGDRDHPGVILLRLPQTIAVDVRNAETVKLLQGLELQSMTNMVAVIEPGSVRIRSTKP